MGGIGRHDHGEQSSYSSPVVVVAAVTGRDDDASAAAGAADAAIVAVAPVARRLRSQRRVHCAAVATTAAVAHTHKRTHTQHRRRRRLRRRALHRPAPRKGGRALHLGHQHHGFPATAADEGCGVSPPSRHHRWRSIYLSSPPLSASLYLARSVPAHCGRRRTAAPRERHRRVGWSPSLSFSASVPPC